MSDANPSSSSFDRDGDSLMHSDIEKPTTPIPQIRSVAISDLSPPNSQGVPLPSHDMPTVAPSASGANMNGKRPIESIDQNGDGGVSLLSAAIPTDAQVKTHAATGYSWARPEDEPGYSWKNKKAQDDFNRAWDSLVDRNRRVGNKYGDTFAMADRELALMQQQQLHQQ